jgi:P4 family phage/plasmid primase-like protien
VKPDTQAAVTFLQRLYPEGPWTVAVIEREGGAPLQRTFDEVEELHAFVAEWNGVRNVYFSVNPLRSSFEKKAEKRDVERVCYLHCDVDPRVREPLHDEQTRIEQLLINKLPPGVPAPTFTIFTGGGYSAFWQLADPIQMPPDSDSPAWEQAREEAEGRNRHLESVLGGDHCFNIERIMRLPGTVNLPSEKKVKNGRADALARVVNSSGKRYARAEFKQAAPKQSVLVPLARDAATPGARLGSLDELDQWDVPGRIKVVITLGYHPDEPPKEPNNSRSEWLFDAVCWLVRRRVPDAVVLSLITDRDLKISASVLEAPDPEKYARRQIARAHELVDAEPPTLHPERPADSAREFIRRGRPTLMHTNGDWLEFDRAAYAEREVATVRSELYEFLRRALMPPGKDDPGPKPFNPNKTKVSNIVDALEGVAHKPRDTFTPPCWLRGEDRPPPRELVVCSNGLLHLPTKRLLPPTPDYFTRNALGVAFDPAAPEPTEWLRFLDQLWARDPENIPLLQEVLGYLMANDTSLQKIFLLVGPTRGGKGTIAQVVQSLVGLGNCCAPSLGDLGSSFGLEPLVAKELAVVSDLRMGHLTDHGSVAERLLSISGEDMLTIGRKYKSAWSGRLSVRFLILTNLMPRFSDASPALANRFVPLVMSESFLGREDLGLKSRLLAELPGVMNWAIAGRERLLARGHFLLPRSGREAVEQITDLASPEATFLRDACEVGTGLSAPKAVLYGAWKHWCAETGQPHVGSDAVFSRNLQAAAGGRVSTAKVRRVPTFMGVRLREVVDPRTGELPL